MFNIGHIKKYIFISSLLINFLIITLILLSKGQVNTPVMNKGDEKTAEVITTPNPTVAGASEELYLVKRVIDGDTITLDNGEVIRYIGIDTPEQKDCLSREATDKNKTLVEGKMVRLVKDISERDRYARLLRYVYVEPPSQSASASQSVFVNEYLVREGYAKVSTYPPDVKYQDLFLEAERQARENNLGLWGSICPTP